MRDGRFESLNGSRGRRQGPSAIAFATVLGWLLLAGCARQQTASPAANGQVTASASASGSKTIVTRDEGLDGKVAWVNPDLHFVVVTFPVGQLPSTGRQLSVFRRGLKVGEVRITGPQKDDSIVGDMVAGEAAAGDSVREP